MTIREAKQEDLEQIRPLAERWKEEGNMSIFNLSASVDIHLEDIKGMIKEGRFLVAYTDNNIMGYMGIRKFKNPLGNEWIASEHFWYVLPEYRGKTALSFINRFKEWAIENGCTHIMMTASYLSSNLHDRICKLYEVLKMKKFETTFISEV